MLENRKLAIRKKLRALGTRDDTMYTNEEMCARLEKLQEGMAESLSVLIPDKQFQPREVMSKLNSLVSVNKMNNTPEYQRLCQNMKEFSHTLGGLINGINGEREIQKSLRLLECDRNVKLLFNIALEDEEGAKTEYDALAITPYGIFVLEVKNYSFAVRLNERGIIQEVRNPHHCYNLGGRMNCKEYLLRKMLGSSFTAPYHGILVYTNEAAKITDDFGKIPISYTNTIVQDIRRYDNDEQYLSSAQIKRIVSKLSKKHTAQKFRCDVKCDEIIDDFSSLVAALEAASGIVTVTEKAVSDESGISRISAVSADNKKPAVSGIRKAGAAVVFAIGTISAALVGFQAYNELKR